MTVVKKPGLGIASNPNATIAIVSGSGIGEAIIKIADHFHQHISRGWAVAVGGAVAGGVLFFWDKGINGVWARIKNGKGA